MDQYVDHITVVKNRSITFEFTLGHQIGTDVYTSEIRVGQSVNTPLIATWNVSVKPGGLNRTLIFSMDNSVTAPIVQSHGWMDLKRVSGGEPLPVLDYAIPVLFKDAITA